MQERVEQLREFVRALTQRPDIELIVAEFWEPLAPNEVERVRVYDEELADMFASMNGVHIEWEFVETKTRGGMYIPSFESRDGWWVDGHRFGFGNEALLLDESAENANAWIVRNKHTKEDRRIYFESRNGIEEPVQVASTIDRYLKTAIKRGMVDYWQRCFQHNPHVSYIAHQEAVKRFQAEPIIPVAIEPGARVQFRYFSEGGRAVVLEQHVGPPTEWDRYYGNRFAKLKTDEGTIGWFPEKHMSPLRRVDAYETLRDPDFDFSEQEPNELFETLARAIGRFQHSSVTNAGTYSSNARRAAGMLSLRSLEDAFDAVMTIHREAKRFEPNLSKRIPLEQTGDEFSPGDFMGSWFYSIDGMLSGLVSGLTLLIRHASKRDQKNADELVEKSAMVRFESEPALNSAVGLLKKKNVLPVPVYYPADAKQTDAQNLPDDLPLYGSTGH